MVAYMKNAKPNVVNGINVDDLFALIEGVKRNASEGKTSWQVTTTWQHQTRRSRDFRSADNRCRAGS
jgi:hypothetical protein